MKSVNDLMPMIGARFYVEAENQLKYLLIYQCIALTTATDTQTDSSQTLARSYTMDDCFALW